MVESAGFSEPLPVAQTFVMDEHDKDDGRTAAAATAMAMRTAVVASSASTKASTHARTSMRMLERTVR
eukprot:COSAG01_NODE_15095_length_1375_cov_2.517241_1_plen_68_part_00